MSSHKDFFFKKTAIQNHYIDENTMEKLLEVQKDLEKEGIKSSLEEIAVKEGAIDKEQLKVLNKQVINEMNLGVTRELPSSNRRLRNVHKKFAEYEILEEIAHNSLTKVYKARNAKNDNRVAIKEICFTENIGKVEIDFFFEEIVKCQILDHPHIEHIYESYRDNDPPFFVAELIEGETFHTAKERLSTIRIVEIIHKIAESLSYAHQQKVYHRDLTSENIVLDDFGDPVLVNFALSETIINTGGIIISGTPSYMSPEQATGIQRQIDHQSNVFSLGIIFYEALTGKLPFMGKDKEEIIAKIQTQDAIPVKELSDEIPESLNKICSKALKRDRTKRYLSMEEMLGDLDFFLQGKPLPLHKKKSNMWMIVVFIAIVIALTLLFNYR